MSCGSLHAVLRDPLLLGETNPLTAAEWFEFFGEGGARVDEEVRVRLVAFKEVEDAALIWATDQWAETARTFRFFARSPPEVVRAKTRRTEADPELLASAGFVPVASPPPTAFHLMDDAIEVDHEENAMHALVDGVAAYLAARRAPNAMLIAVPSLFRALELALKARLLQLDPNGLRGKPDNPAVLKRLAVLGVNFSAGERATIDALRRLRNDLQHGAAKFNHRAGLSIARRSTVLLERFLRAELNVGIAGELPPELWQQLLLIPEIAEAASLEAEHRVREASAREGVVIEDCSMCGRHTVIWPDPKSPARVCAYCSHWPVIDEEPS